MKIKEITSQSKFNIFKETNEFPSSIPRDPQGVYGKISQWVSWGDFLSSGRIATRNREYREFNKGS